MHAAEQDASAEVFVIGGASIYQLAMPLAQTIYLTRVHAQIPGDTFFELNPADWEITTNQRHTADDKNPYDYSFITLKRR
jgi:dihydrofolate reductase